MSKKELEEQERRRQMLGREGDGTSEVLEKLSKQITDFESEQGQLQKDIKALGKSAFEKK